MSRGSPPKGAKGESNSRPLAPKARIIPLDHWPLTVSEALGTKTDTPRGIRTLNPQIRSLMRYPVAPLGHNDVKKLGIEPQLGLVS